MHPSAQPTIRALILDMDGVLWRGDQPLGDLPKIFNTLHERGYRVALATNNATLSIMDYQLKIRRFGVELEDWQIVNSSQAVGHFLKQRFPKGGNVYIVGESGLIDTLASYGFLQDDQDVLAVVAGMDRYLTYEKLRKATLLIRKGTMFVGTNPDRTYPLPEGLVPGAGAILAALEAATDCAPLIIGKPAPEMYRVALERLAVPAEQTLVVGDRLETDIAGAQTIGCQTALVLSGVTTKEAAIAWKPAPDWIEASLTALVSRL
jgi:HAD superfamily hydrolase (TIGR01450 family)